MSRFCIVLRAIVLTLPLMLSLSGCVYIRRLYTEPCKNRAYVQLIVEDYLSRRFHSKAPVRVAVVPFSVPANFASMSDERPGLGNELAWQLHAKLLESGRLPVVEVFNRPDWPRKKAEFFTGNFGALSFAEQAGYDLVLVGLLEELRDTTHMSAHAKLIEVESGITVWYGKSTVESLNPSYKREGGIPWPIGTFRPDMLEPAPLVDNLTSCIVTGLLSEKPVPE